MKKFSPKKAAGLFLLIGTLIIACNDDSTTAVVAGTSETAEMTEEEMIQKGDYLVATSGCNDCHTPKIFGPDGFPHLDSSRLLSGYPGTPLPPIDPKALEPGNWVLFSPDLTTAVGPWGMTHTANLTPDTATGIGNWTANNFIKAMRTGKHMGLDEGRPIMPPMPWFDVGRKTDEDLKAMFMFLKSLPPINNRVPDPTPPPAVAQMSKK